MITILHGEKISASRIKLRELLSAAKDAEIIVLNGLTVELSEIIQALEANSLFGQKKVIVIENFLSDRLKGHKKENEILNYLQGASTEDHLILWEKKEIEKNLLALLPKAQIKLFRPDPLLFKFLESLAPIKKNVMIDMLRDTLKFEEPELVFYMLVRQFRLLILIKAGLKKGIEDLNKLAVWQIERLQRQAKYFTMEKLRENYQELLEIDFKQKTGQAVFDLGKTLEVFLLEI